MLAADRSGSARPYPFYTIKKNLRVRIICAYELEPSPPRPAFEFHAGASPGTETTCILIGYRDMAVSSWSGARAGRSAFANGRAVARKRGRAWQGVPLYSVALRIAVSFTAWPLSQSLMNAPAQRGGDLTGRSFRGHQNYPRDNFDQRRRDNCATWRSSFNAAASAFPVMVHNRPCGRTRATLQMSNR